VIGNVLAAIACLAIGAWLTMAAVAALAG